MVEKEFHRKNITAAKIDGAWRVGINVTAVAAVASLFLTLLGIWGVFKLTINSMIDDRVKATITSMVPDMEAAADKAHNAMRQERSILIEQLASDLAEEKSQRKESQAEIKDELKYIRERLDILVARR